MSVATSRTKMVASLKELRVRWDRVRAVWADDVAKSFEEEYIAPLDGKVRSCATAMERMNDLVSQARRDCQ